MSSSLRKRRRVIALSGTLLLLLGAAYLAKFGRLAPFAPRMLEANRFETEGAIVYSDAAVMPAEFASIDSVVAGVERFHGLRFRSKPEFTLCETDLACRRRTGIPARFVTMPLHGRIYISKTAQQESRRGQIRFLAYMRHELSHAILYQNMSLTDSLDYPGWFMEGVAMVSAEQTGTDGYYSYRQVEDALAKGILAKPDDWGTILSAKGPTVKNCPLEGKYWFVYSEFALIVRDLIDGHGEDKVMRFLKRSLKGENFSELFHDTFGISPLATLDRYKPAGHGHSQR